MLKTAKLLWHVKNSIAFKLIVARDISNCTPEKCAQLIRNGIYDPNYDLNNDGYLNSQDYNILYNKWYGRHNELTSGTSSYDNFDIRVLVHIKKMIANPSITYNSDYDLDNDGHVTELDLNICKRWLLVDDVPERETFT